MLVFMRCLCAAGFMGFLIGCAAETGNAPSAAVESAKPAVFNVAGAPTVEFSVPDMMCPDSCAVKTKEILAEQSGAKDVRVDFATKTATVAVQEGKFDAEQALAALADHGFDQSTLKTDATDQPQPAEAPIVQ